MRVVNVHEAKTTLSALLNEVEQGQEVTIARNGTPVARLVAIRPAVRREPGVLRHDPAWRDFVYDPAIFAPMNDAEVVDEGWV